MSGDSNAPAATATSSIDWNSIASTVGNVVSALAPIAETAIPAAAPAISIATKIIQGVINEEPTAVALYQQITGGTPATPTQLQQFATAYEASYQKLNADIETQLKALGAAS